MSALSEKELQQITDQPTMAQLLPYVFDNGSRVDSITISCSTCGKNVPPEHAHGEIVLYGETAALKAFLLCYNCKTISPFECKLRPEGTLLIKGDTTWTEARYAEEPGLIQKAKAILGILR